MCQGFVRSRDFCVAKEYRDEQKLNRMLIEVDHSYLIIRSATTHFITFPHHVNTEEHQPPRIPDDFSIGKETGGGGKDSFPDFSYPEEKRHPPGPGEESLS